VANEWTEYEAYRDNFKSGNAIEIKITKFPQKMDVNKSLASIVTDETHLVSDQLIEIDGRFGKFWVARDRPHTYSAIWWMNTTTPEYDQRHKSCIIDCRMLDFSYIVVLFEMFSESVLWET
jgi:hypothetical protein